MRDIAINDVRKIERIVFNPTGSSIALLRAKNPISIYSFRDRNKKLFELKEKRKKLKAKPMPVSMCYSADARSFIVGNSLGEIVIYDTKEYMPLAYIQGRLRPLPQPYEFEQLFYRHAWQDRILISGISRQRS